MIHCRKVFFVFLCGIVLLNVKAQNTSRHYNYSTDARLGVADNRVDFSPTSHVATSPFAVSFSPQFELPFKTWDVCFIRLSPLVGRHRLVYGVDLAGLGNFTDFKMNGVACSGLFNSTGESDGSIQIAGLCNFVAFNFSGCQISGLYSCVEASCLGCQIGVANYAGSITGVQVGAVNFAERLCGVQIGLFNFNQSSCISFMPIINSGF